MFFPKGSIIFFLFNVIALLIYFFVVCSKYGCIYLNKKSHVLNLPFAGITRPLTTLVTNFPVGVQMMMSPKNAWVYIFIASSLAIITIILLRNFKKNEESNDRSQPSVAH